MTIIPMRRLRGLRLLWKLLTYAVPRCYQLMRKHHGVAPALWYTLILTFRPLLAKDNV